MSTESDLRRPAVEREPQRRPRPPLRTGRWVPLLAVGLFVLLGASVALAQETRLQGKFRTGNEVVVPAGETVRGDLYASGGLVRVEGTVLGDLVAAGGQVQIPGQVRGDVLAAGGTLDISGRVGGDARVAGGRVTVGGPVSEDLVVGAGQATVTPGGRVGQDLIFGAGQMTVDGQVAGNVLGSTGTYTRHGSVRGSEEVTVVEREKGKPAVRTVGDRVLDGVRRFVGILAVAALLVWLFPRVLTEPAAIVRRRPLASLGVGALTMIGLVVFVVAVLVVAVLLAVVLGLLGLGDLVVLALFAAVTALVLVGFLFFVAVTFVAPAAVGLALGALARPLQPPARPWLALALGVLVVVILTSLPIVGGWLGFLVVLFGLGAALLALRQRRRAEERAAEPAPVA